MISETQQMFSSPQSPYSARRHRNVPQPTNPPYDTSPRHNLPQRHDRLPEIRTDSPKISGDNQLLPYEKKTGTKTPYVMYSNMIRDSYDDQNENTEKFDMRLNIAEKSNRALLEEVIRLQNDLKSTTMNNEAVLHGERTARQQLEASFKSSSQIIEQLNDRIMKTEQKVMEERATLTSLVNHTKQVEQAVIGSQQQMLTRKDAQGSRIDELRDELGKTRQSRDGLERMSAMLSEDMRGLKAKLEDQESQMKSIQVDFTQRAERLEDDNKQTVTAVRRQGAVQSQSDQTATHLRGQIDTRLSELRGVIVDLRTKGDEEADNRRNLEQMFQARMNELTTSIGEQNRKREETSHALDLAIREKEHEVQQRCNQLQHKMAESVEEMSHRALTKDIAMREDTQNKFLNVDKLLQQEQSSRLDFEKDVRDASEKRWMAVRKLEEEEISTLRDTIKNDSNKSRETLQKLDEAITLIEKELRENKRQVEKIMAAEIKSRKAHESKNQSLIGEVQAKLQVATSSLQQAIGGVSSQLNEHRDKLHHDIRHMIEDSEQSRVRALADLDAQLVSVKKKVNLLEESLETRLTASDGKIVAVASPASLAMTQNLREKMSAFNQWQELTNQSVRDLNTEVRKIPEEIYQADERFKLLKSETDHRITTESDTRLREIQSLQEQIMMLQKKGPDELLPLKEDIANCQMGVRKLAESIQTVKTVLGMKLQSEQKLRLEEVNDLHLQLVRLRALVKPLINRPPEPRLFIKDTETRDRLTAEKDAISINKWSLYTAYRWHRWLVCWRGPAAFRNPRTFIIPAPLPLVANEPSDDRETSEIDETGSESGESDDDSEGGTGEENDDDDSDDDDDDDGTDDDTNDDEKSSNDDADDDEDSSEDEEDERSQEESEFDEANILNDGSNENSDSSDNDL